ncbi:MAG: hypothetical protein ACKVQS_05670 [Fimbriimonadaceae bacterium]
MSRILAVTYGAGHVNMIIPVAQKLIAHGHEVVVLALTTAWGPAHRAGLTTVGFRDYLSDSDERALEHGRRLIEGTTCHADVHPDETVAYLGLSYSDLEDRMGVDRAASEFALKGRQSLLPIGPLKRVFDTVKPNMLLTTNSPRGERASVLVAQELGAPSVVLNDLMPQSEMEWLSEVGYGDKVCVLSKGVKQRLVEAGRFEDEVVVTGNPAFDDLFDIDRKDLRSSWREKFGFGDEDRVVLFASQPDSDSALGSRVAAAVVCAGRESGWKTVFRPHPNEDFDANLLPESTPISGRDDDLFAALCGSDACVVISSSVGVQAAILGLPLVVLDIPVHADPAPYFMMGIGTTVQTAEAVFEALNSGIGVSAFESGKATVRIVTLIEELLRDRQS